MWAAAEGHVDVVDVLLEGGRRRRISRRASRELKNASTRTIRAAASPPLMWAVRNGDEAVVRRLVEGGADLNVTQRRRRDRDDARDRQRPVRSRGQARRARRRRERRFALSRRRDARCDDGLVRARRLAAARRSSRTSARRSTSSHCCSTRARIRTSRSSARCTPRRCAATRRRTRTPFYRAAVAADVEALKLMVAHERAISSGRPTQRRERPVQARTRHVGKTPLMVAMNGGKGVRHGRRPRLHRVKGAPPFREVMRIASPPMPCSVLLEAGANADARRARRRHRAASGRRAAQCSIRARARPRAAQISKLKNGDGQTALDMALEAEARRSERESVRPGAQVKTGASPEEVVALLRELRRRRPTRKRRASASKAR